MARELAVVPGEGGNCFVFIVAHEICHVEAKVLFQRQAFLVTDFRLLQAIGPSEA